MKKNMYESAVLINAAVEDDQIETIINRIKETISNNGGEIREIENWGRKRLAYTVKKSKIGYYAIFRFNAASLLIPNLERFYRLDENILRYLTISLTQEALDQINKDKTQAEEIIEESEKTNANSNIVEETTEEIAENETTNNYR